METLQRQKQRPEGRYIYYIYYIISRIVLIYILSPPHSLPLATRPEEEGKEEEKEEAEEAEEAEEEEEEEAEEEEEIHPQTMATV